VLTWACDLGLGLEGGIRVGKPPLTDDIPQVNAMHYELGPLERLTHSH
jgi:hypothetical protein